MLVLLPVLEHVFSLYIFLVLYPLCMYIASDRFTLSALSLLSLYSFSTFKNWNLQFVSKNREIKILNATTNNSTRLKLDQRLSDADKYVTPYDGVQDKTFISVPKYQFGIQHPPK